jgi:hypothetical protein
MTGRQVLAQLTSLGYRIDVAGPERTPHSIDEILALFEATPAVHIDLQLWTD